MSALLSGPFFSIVLIVLAGIALRYALWYGSSDGQPLADDGELDSLRDRSDQLQSTLTAEREQASQMKTEFEEISAEYQALQKAFDERDARYSSLNSSHQAIETKNKQLQQTCDSLQSTLEETQVELDQLRDMQSAHGEVDTALEQERHRREQLEDLLASAESKLTLLEADSRFADTLRQEQGQLKTSLHQSAERMRDLETERVELIAKIGEADERVSQLQNVVDQQNQRIHCYVSELEALGQSADQRVLEVEQTYQSKAEGLTAQLEQAASQRDDHSNEISRLLEQISQLETAQHEVVQLNEERSDLRQQLAESKSRCEQLEARMTDHETQQATVDQHIKDITTEKEEVLHGLQREKSKNAQLREDLEELEKRISILDETEQQVELLGNRCKEYQDRLSAMEATNHALETDREQLDVSLIQARRRVAELDGSIVRFEQELAGSDSLIRKLTNEKENLQIQLERERSERNAVERMLRIHSETLEQLRVDSQSLESLLERQTVVQQSLQEQAERLRSVSGTTDATIIQMADHELPTQYHADNDQRTDEVLGKVYRSSPPHRDNLQRISGIGEALEYKLNELGFYTFEQIIGWDRQAIDHISSLLSFSDRIVRDDWQGQARMLQEQDQNSQSRAA